MVGAASRNRSHDMGKHRLTHSQVLAAQQVHRMRTDRFYGPVDERMLAWLRLPDLHPGIRLRLLHTVFEGGTMKRRRFLYTLWSWHGRWTWGFGFDSDGFGLYLGPLSLWWIWRGK